MGGMAWVQGWIQSAVWNCVPKLSIHMTLPAGCFLCPITSLPPLSLQSSMPAIMTMLADHAARQLLDFNQKLDINLLDNVVNCLYHGVGQQVRKAHAAPLFFILITIYTWPRGPLLAVVIV